MPTVLQAAMQLPVVTIVANGMAISLGALGGSGSTLNLNVTDSIVTKNTASAGGGMSICFSDQSTAGGVTLDRVVFERNRARPYSGGGLVSGIPSITITNSVFINISAVLCGSAICALGSADLVNVTATRNRASQGAGGVVDIVA